MWQLDPRFHTPGWAERRLKELGLPSKSEQDYAYVVEATTSNGDVSCSVSEMPVQGLSPVTWPEHDGILDDQGKLQVSLSFSQVWIQGEYEAILTPSQALSLLAYLKQEEGTLKKLAEEQAH